MKSAEIAPRTSAAQPQHDARDPPRLRLAALLAELHEDGHEGRRDRGVGDEAADQVRHVERDQERAERRARAEVVGGRLLANDTGDPGERGRRSERRGGYGQAPPIAHRRRVYRARCYHLRRPWPTPSNRRSAFEPLPGSGSRTCATAPRSRRSSAGCARRSTPATASRSPRRTSGSVSVVDRAAARHAIHRNAAVPAQGAGRPDRQRGPSLRVTRPSRISVTPAAWPSANRA